MHKLLISLTCIASATASHFKVPRFHVPKPNPDHLRSDQVQEYFFETDLDHFDNGGNMEKFKIRYLVDDTYWDPEIGPILFYAGNEGNIYSFYDNVGFMTETIAQETKGLLVFGEHRYFGVSYPYDPFEAFTPEHNIYLTVEQAMMDYVDLIKFIRQEYKMEDKACIVFGGSYGGMLAGWLRMKFPATFQGALAASAPILYFKDAPSASPHGFSDITTQDFRAQLDKAPALIKESFRSLMSTADRSDAWADVSAIFNTCAAIADAGDIENLYLHLSAGYQYMAMTDYPEAASFLEPMPAWPVKDAVKPFGDIPVIDTDSYYAQLSQVVSDVSVTVLEYITDAFDYISVKVEVVSEPAAGLNDRETTLLNALSESTQVYFNYTGQYPCTNLSDTTGTGDLDGYGWNILACNQLAMPIGDGAESMFIETPFDYDSYTAWCQESYGLTPDYTWPLRYFGGFDIDKDFLGTTNIVFSNGELDPWRAGGLNKNVTADGSGIALFITDGSHHTDLRTPDPADPPTITEARAVEMANIKKWIAEYQNL